MKRIGIYRENYQSHRCSGGRKLACPRVELVKKAYDNLVGENPQKGGHYFTVWGPRQTGKTWVMQQILMQLKKDPRFHTL